MPTKIEVFEELYNENGQMLGITNKAGKWRIIGDENDVEVYWETLGLYSVVGYFPSFKEAFEYVSSWN